MARFLITRILGNDVPMTHGDNQTYVNLQFTLENEPAFESTDKLYVLNSIIDGAKKARLIDLLDSYGAKYVDIPFSDFPPIDDATASFVESNMTERNITREIIIKWHHAIYPFAIMLNLNKARNFCVDYGQQHGYEWTFVMDSNTFFTNTMFSNIVRNIAADTDMIVIPLKRLKDNVLILTAEIDDVPVDEPQLAFRNTVSHRFNEALPYGVMNKAELLNAIGIKGRWNIWPGLRYLNMEQRRFTDVKHQVLSSVARLHRFSEKENDNFLFRMFGVYQMVKQYHDNLV